MKKLITVLMAMVLLLVSTFYVYAVAEAPDAPAMPVVDLTGLIIAVLLAVFEFLMARFARVLIPPAKKWLVAHTSEKERGLLWNAVCELVEAAEQIIKGPALGERRMAYVQAGLRQRGLAIDTDMIEAAVKRMKDRTFATLAEGLEIREGNVETTKTTETEVEIDDYPHLPPLEEWPMEMIVAFTRDNGIPHEGCETKEEYIEAIVRAVKENGETTSSAPDGAPSPEGEGYAAEGCAEKDYCELDEDGNQVPEEPQSGNE